MKRQRIALTVIARDEETRIGRLLASVAPWVDAMLVLDTGSQDDTVAVARRHGARVEHCTWCDDFAAARNASLDLAAADWHLVLDADEWLIDGGALLQGLSDRLTDELKLRVWVAEDPLTCVARGAGMVFEDFDNMSRYLVGLERGSTRHTI